MNMHSPALFRIDVRVYDVLTGKLKKVFTDLNEDERISDLSSFCYGGKQRKFYVGDNSGHIRVYNMQTGDRIKKVNSEKEEIEFKENFFQRNVTIKKKENCEVSKILFLTDEKLLITSCWDSIIRIYDETEPTESTLLRIMSGGHRDSDIAALAYSSNLSLLASGSGNGIITVWDFESGKVESILLGHNGDITCLQFADPYPLLISGSSDGSLCVWAVRPAVSRYKYKCLLRVMNSYWIGDEEKRVGINTLVVETGVMEGMSRKAPESNTGVNPSFPTNDEYRSFVEKMEMKDKDSRSATTPVQMILSRKSEMNSAYMFFEKESNKEKDNDKDKDKEKSVTASGNPVDDNKASLYLHNNMLEESLINPFKQPDSSVEIYELMEDFKKYQRTYDHDVTQKKHRCYIYFGDQKGFISLIDISEIIKKRDIFSFKSEKKSDSYQLRRKDWIDASKTIENLFKYEKKKVPFTVHSFNTVLIKRWEAHQQAVQSIVKTEDPKCYITCSPDKHVKLFTVDGNMLGDINLVKLGKGTWKIPFDWVKHKLNELDEVSNILKKIEKEEHSKLSAADKDAIKNRYLLSVYCGDKDFATISQNLRARMEKIPPADQNNEVNAVMNPRYKYQTIEVGQTQQRMINYNHPSSETKEPKKYLNLEDFTDRTQRILKELEKYDSEHGRESSLNNSRTQIKFRTVQEKSKSSKLLLRSTESSGAFLAKSAQKRNHSRGKTSYDHRSDKFSSMGSVKQMSISHQTNAIGNSGIKEESQREDEKSLERDDNYDHLHVNQGRLFSRGASSVNLKSNTKQTVKSYSKPRHRLVEFDDIKFRIGEGARSLKLAAKQQISRFDSQSPQLFANENEALRRRSTLYNSLRSSYGFNASKMDGVDTARTFTEEKTYKIVAKKIFMNDPNQNKPRFLKNRGRLYVL